MIIALLAVAWLVWEFAIAPTQPEDYDLPEWRKHGND